MARYLYSCTSCQKQFEVEKNMNRSAEPESCPDCHAPARRVFTVPGISIKAKCAAPEGSPCADAGPACEGCDNGCCGE